MATTNILQFSPNDIGTNLLTDAAYLAASDRSNGNQPGVASAKLNNKALRQSSAMAAGLAQYMANKQATNVTDALTPSQIATMLGAAFGGQLLGIQLVVATASYAPTAGAKNSWVRAVGGGGGGGGAVSTATGNTGGGLGGAAGGYVEGYYPVSSLTGQVMTIGAFGSGVAGANGANGGATSFGAIFSAPGGAGGAVGQNLVPPWLLGEGGNGSNPTGGNIANTPGETGQGALSLSTAALVSGRGGSTLFGAGGNARGTIRGGGSSGTGYGAGGGGALETSAGPGGLAGGQGSQGCIIIFEFGG